MNEHWSASGQRLTMFVNEKEKSECLHDLWVQQSWGSHGLWRWLNMMQHCMLCIFLSQAVRCGQSVKKSGHLGAQLLPRWRLIHDFIKHDDVCRIPFSALQLARLNCWSRWVFHSAVCRCRYFLTGGAAMVLKSSSRWSVLVARLTAGEKPHDGSCRKHAIQ